MPKTQMNKNYLLSTFLIVIAAVGGWWWGTNQNKITNDHHDGLKDDVIAPQRLALEEEAFLSTLQPLRLRLIQMVNDLPDEAVSMYLEYLPTGANIDINKEGRMWPASLPKLPLAMSVLKKVEKGQWRLDDELVMLPDDRNENWGTLFKDPIGTRYTIEKLVTEVLVHSDNTAFEILYRNMDQAETIQISESMGLDALFDKEGKVSAKEYARIIRSLYVANYLSPDSSRFIINKLADTPYDQRYLGAGFPTDAQWAHKIGEDNSNESVLDAGILYIGNRRMLMVVMINYSLLGGGDPGLAKADELMKEFGTVIYDYLEDGKMAL